MRLRSPAPEQAHSSSKASRAKSRQKSRQQLPIPTIGIGAGPDCDGQILVYHDLLNLTFAPSAKFVRRYADAGSLIRSAIEHYREDVEHRAFPSDEESYHLPKAAPDRPLSITKAKTPSSTVMHGKSSTSNPDHSDGNLRTADELRQLVSQDHGSTLRNTSRPRAHHGRAARRATPRSSAPPRPRARHVAVSIFVNPTQFGPNEDFARYPRTFDADCALADRRWRNRHLCSRMSKTSIRRAHPHSLKLKDLSNRLDGLSRPGHFRGVATVVAKLLIAAEADRAYFGQKDAAQVAVIRRMVTDLRIATEIVVCPIVRDADGLALSSRNAYLSPHRTRAGPHTQPRNPTRSSRCVSAGERNPRALIAAARSIFASEPAVRIDYIECVNWSTLEPVEVAAPGTLFAVAAYVGTTRLIDNTILR